MRKVWIYKRKRIKGWWVGWYESGKRKAKALPTKALAEHYRQIKYAQLNSDVFTGTITVDWQQMVEEYRHDKQVAGIVEDSLYEVALTLRHFERLVGKCNSKQITQNAIDTFILDEASSEGESPRSIPDSKMREYKRPSKTIPRSTEHHEEWGETCKAGDMAASEILASSGKHQMTSSAILITRGF